MRRVRNLYAGTKDFTGHKKFHYNKNSGKQNSYSVYIPFKPMKKNLLISSEAE